MPLTGSESKEGVVVVGLIDLSNIYSPSMKIYLEREREGVGEVGKVRRVGRTREWRGRVRRVIGRVIGSVW